MAGKERPRRSRPRRWIRRVILLAAVVALLGLGYQQIKPLLMQGQTILYEPFEVRLGDVQTSMSLSGAISVGADETITNTSSASFTDMLMVREIFVEESQKVSEGDKLLQLSNGDIYRAGIDGTVNEIRVAQGDLVRPNASMMQICDVDHLIVTISVDEFDIDKVAVGQKCTITVLPLGISFDTQIGHINRVSNAMGWVATYTVTADANAPESVWPGMQATVSIAQSEAMGVPVLDMNAISFDEDGVPYVLMREADGTYGRREIEVGLSDGLNVEIREGLSVGDTVWAATGVEETEPALSLSEIYKRIFGEKVVIVDRSGAGNREARGDWSGAALPEGVTLPDDAQLPEGVELPEGMTRPENMTRPGMATPGEAGGERTWGTPGTDGGRTRSNPDDAAAQTGGDDA